MHDPFPRSASPAVLARGAAGAMLLCEARRKARWTGRPPLPQEA